ncbi:MAG: hypothetical protein WBE26_00580, partial [Phycisphaerae bacterium]
SYPSAILIFLAVSAAAPRVGNPCHKVEADRLIFAQIPVRAAARADEVAIAPRVENPCHGVGAHLPIGSRIVAYDPDRPDDSVKTLTSGFAAAGQPDVSFDGKRILFIGKPEASDPFHVWEMNVDGRGIRRITDKSGNVSAAIYLSTIYTLDADKPVYQIAFCSDPGGAPGGSLYTCRMDGTRIRRITFDPNGVSDPHLLSDSRLLFSRWSNSGGAGSPHGLETRATTRSTDLLTVNTDGTDLFAFAAVHESPAIRSMPCETPDGWVVYVESAACGTGFQPVDRGGSLVAVARSRSLHTRRVVADDPGGLYHSPSAMADGKLLVSYRPKDGGSYGIYVLDPVSGTRVARVFDDPQWHEVDAVVARSRSTPAGRSSVVKEQLDYGLLYCMNANLSDREEAKAIEPGQIKRLRVFKATTNDERGPNDAPGHEQTAARGGIIVEELLGEVPVERDGSFFLMVPDRTPLRVETLDANGRILQSMVSWIWVMPNEGRGCIGCHEDRELTPPNRHVLALRKRPRRVGVSDRLPYPHGEVRPGLKKGE